MTSNIPDGFFHEAVSKAPYAIAAVSLDGKFLFVNHFFSILTGYSNTELTTLSWMDITHHEDIGADILEVNKVIKGENNFYTMTKRYIKKNGDVIDVEIAVYKYPQDSEIIMFIVYVKDIMTADTYIKKLTTEMTEMKSKCEEFKKSIHTMNEADFLLQMIKKLIIAKWGIITIFFTVLSTIIGWVISIVKGN